MSLCSILQNPKECRGYLEFLDPPGCHCPGPSWSSFGISWALPITAASGLLFLPLLGSSMAFPQLSWLCLMPQLISVLPRFLWAPSASLGQVFSKQSEAQLTAGPMRIQGGPGIPRSPVSFPRTPKGPQQPASLMRRGLQFLGRLARSSGSENGAPGGPGV